MGRHCLLGLPRLVVLCLAGANNKSECRGGEPIHCHTSSQLGAGNKTRLPHLCSHKTGRSKQPHLLCSHRACAHTGQDILPISEGLPCEWVKSGRRFSSGGCVPLSSTNFKRHPESSQLWVMGEAAFICCHTLCHLELFCSSSLAKVFE